MAVLLLMPDYAIISCGANNEYGHQHGETMDLLDQAGGSLSDRFNGNIIVKLDGKDLSFETSK